MTSPASAPVKKNGTFDYGDEAPRKTRISEMFDMNVKLLDGRRKRPVWFTIINSVIVLLAAAGAAMSLYGAWISAFG